MTCENDNWQIVQPTADVNRFLNPSIEFGTDEFTTASSTLTRDSTEAWVGASSLKATNAGAAPDWYSQQALSVTIGATYYFKVRVKGVVGQTYNVVVYNAFPANVAATTSFVADGTWQETTLTFTTTVATPTYRVAATLQAGSPFYTDGIEVVSTADATYIDGDQEDCVWDGFNHSSASRRLAGLRRGGAFVDLEDYHFKPGNEQGTGMQPGGFKELDRPERPGTETTGFKLPARQFALTGVFDRSTWEALRTARNDLIDEISPLSYKKITGKPQPVRWFLTGSENDLFIDAHYAGGLEFNIDASQGVKERAGLRLLANDNPYFRQYPQGGAELDYIDEVNVYLTMARIDGEWTNIDTASALAAETMNAVAVGNDGLIYYGGNYTSTIGGVANTDYAAAYTPNADAWSALDGGAIAAAVYVILPLPDGRLFFGGAFTNVDGDANADYATIYDPSTDDYSALNAQPLNGAVYDAALDPSTGDVIIVGAFTQDSAATALNYVCRWTGGAANYSAIGGGLDATVYGVGVRSDGQIIVAGSHTEKISACDSGSTTWYEVGNSTGANGNGECVIVRKRDDDVFVGGVFTTFDGETANSVVKFGTITSAYVQWQALGDGVTGGTVPVRDFAFTPDEDILIVVGDFTALEGTTYNSRTARWNGSEWLYQDIELFDTTTRTLYAVATSSNGSEWYAVQNLAVINPTHFSSDTTVTLPDGASETWPVIELYNTSSVNDYHLTTIQNFTNEQRLDFDLLAIFPGELITIDCVTGTISSSIGRNLQSGVKGSADFREFYLMAGDNKVLIFIDDTSVAGNVIALLRYHTQYWSLDAAEDST